MNRLPFELLNLIVHCIEAETSLPTRRSALASLSRTNKTFHNIATPKLYLQAVLTSEKRVGQWGKVYASKLNPWNLKSAKDELKDLVVPTSITFTPSDDDLDDLVLSTKSTAVFPRKSPPIDPLLAVSTPLTSFFFRNLTSFVVSADYKLAPGILANILAPNHSFRINIIHLDISAQGLTSDVNFIFGAFVRFEFELDLDRAEWDAEWDAYENRGDAWLAYWAHRYDQEDQMAEEEPDWLWFNTSPFAEEYRLISKARTDFTSFRQLYAFAPTPLTLDKIRELDPQLFPFSKLESLTLVDPCSTTFGLLLIQPACFSSLRTLRLVGKYDGAEDVFVWTPCWRLAVTKLSGLIIRPDDEASFSALFDEDDFEQDLGPVRPEETILLTHYTHEGPDLLTLDLSELRIV